jgi:hypothetical protein
MRATDLLVEPDTAASDAVMQLLLPRMRRDQ